MLSVSFLIRLLTVLLGDVTSKLIFDNFLCTPTARLNLNGEMVGHLYSVTFLGEPTGYVCIEMIWYDRNCTTEDGYIIKRMWNQSCVRACFLPASNSCSANQYLAVEMAFCKVLSNNLNLFVCDMDKRVGKNSYGRHDIS